jgi:riboflavin kinase/FMN adenylyltransferase
VSVELIRGLSNIKQRHKGCVLTIGNFDGVHLGHKALLKKIVQKAQALNLPSVVMTFEPHPLEFFSKEKCAPRLTRWREKFSELANCGIDRVLVVRFNKSFAAMSAEDFVKKILCDKLGVKHILIGDDFHFGKGREGDFNSLKKMGEKFHFDVEDMPTLIMDQQRVSSTLVRKALADAKPDLVKRYLGRPYTMMGNIVHGDKLGRQLGFPTANIYLHRAAAPVWGIYAVRMHGIAEHALSHGLIGVANVGIRPAVGGTRSLLEVHLFDFDQDIYGKHVTVEFCEKRRNEEHFDTLDLLKEKIAEDVKWARDYFEKGKK